MRRSPKARGKGHLVTSGVTRVENCKGPKLRFTTFTTYTPPALTGTLSTAIPPVASALPIVSPDGFTTINLKGTLRLDSVSTLNSVEPAGG